jgi:hypothetical protein
MERSVAQVAAPEPGALRLPRRRGRLRFDLARPGDEPELRRLLRDNPLSGEIGVSLEREPDFFAAAAVEGPRHRTVVARDPDSGLPVGVGSRSARLCWINGLPAWLPYLGALRMDRAWRGRPREMAEGYQVCRRLREPDELPFCLTSIVADNRPARRLLEAALPGMPVYRPVEEFVTLVIPVRRRLGRHGLDNVEIHRAGPAGMAGVTSLLADFGRRHQFHPVWSPPELQSPGGLPGLTPDDFLLATEHGRPVGCLAVWDQRVFRQTVVRALAPRLARLRPLLNLAVPITHQPRIPSVGCRLDSAFLSHLATEAGSEGVLPALVEATFGDAGRRGLECLLLGLSARSPLLAHATRAFGGRSYRSILYLVHWGDGEPAIAALDGRVAHVEAAIL